MSVLLPALLAAGAVAVLLSPRPGGLRVGAVLERTGPERLAPRSRPRVPPAVARWTPLLPVPLVLLTGAGAVPAVLVALAVLGARRWHRRRQAVTARTAERARAVEACTALAAELRAGRSPAQALEVAAGLAVGPSRRALAAAASAAQLGGDVGAALRPVDGTAVPEVLRALSACWTVCAGTGSGLAAAVERLEQGLRADEDQRRAVAAELAGPRATAGMLAALPAAGLLLAAGLGADPLHVLLHTPVGLVCLVLGLGLDALGLWWTGRLVTRAGGQA